MSEVKMNSAVKTYLWGMLKESPGIPTSVYLYRDYKDAFTKYGQLLESYRNHGSHFEEHSFKEYGDNSLITVAFSNDIKLTIKRIEVEK